MARVFPVTAIKFASYDQIKDIFMPNGEKGYSTSEGFARKAAAGAATAIFVDIFTYPLTVCFTRLTADMAQEGVLSVTVGSHSNSPWSTHKGKQENSKTYGTV